MLTYIFMFVEGILVLRSDRIGNPTVVVENPIVFAGTGVGDVEFLRDGGPPVVSKAKSS